MICHEMMTFVPLVLWHWCLHRTLQQGTASRLVLPISRVSCPRNCKQNSGWWLVVHTGWHIGVVLSSPGTQELCCACRLALLLQARDCMRCDGNAGRTVTLPALPSFRGINSSSVAVNKVCMKASLGGRWNCFFQSYAGNFMCWKKTQEKEPFVFSHIQPKGGTVDLCV